MALSNIIGSRRHATLEDPHDEPNRLVDFRPKAHGLGRPTLMISSGPLTMVKESFKIF